MTKGKVYLVGAGPGDIGLITVKGLRILQRAEVVVYDFHLNPQILNYIRQSAEFIYAGKRGGHHTMTQEQINQLLIQKAREGRIVCRLKGGDPFVFGRGGEEAEMLAREGVPFQVVPGVSSVIAAPAYAGIPLTHRDYSSSFAVITGSEALAKEGSRVDWSTISNGCDTLVFLMGVKNIEAIVQQLLHHGKSGATPAAVIRWGTRPDQKTVVGTLANIAELTRNEEIRPPAVLVVGDVVRLRDSLRWYELRPLFGQRVLITGEYTPDYESLEELGAEVFEFPTVRTAAPESYGELDRAIAAIGGYDWLVFTGVKEFTFFLSRFLENGRDIRDLKGIRLCAAGAGTAGEIARSGMRAELVLESFDAEGLVRALQAKLPNGERTGLADMRFLVPCAEGGTPLFAGAIRGAGGVVVAPAAYRRVRRERHGKRLKTFLTEGRISIASFVSEAAFTDFVQIMGEDARPLLAKTTIAVLSSETAKAVKKAGLRVGIMPPEATLRALVEAIVEWATHS